MRPSKSEETGVPEMRRPRRKIRPPLYADGKSCQNRLAPVRRTVFLRTAAQRFQMVHPREVSLGYRNSAVPLDLVVSARRFF